MKKLNLIAIILLFTLGVSAQTTTTINFDTTGDWTAGSGSLTSYQTDHTFTKGVFSASTSMDALRQSTAAQDGFPGANGTFAWRLRNSGVGAWTAAIASGGVSAFSVSIRRWDDSPNPNYTLDYSTDGGVLWTNVATIDNTILSNSSAYTVFNGTINSANPNILIRVNRVSGERLMIDDFVWTDFSVVVPITLKSFTATKKINANLLAWTTATEINSKQFIVQRSSDGNTFENLGVLKSKGLEGNSSKELDYTFEDYEPMVGHNYYRLEQEDLDGHKNYTEVLDVIWGADGSEIAVYPNPTNEVLHIDLSSNQNAQTEVRIIDMFGQLVHAASKKTSKGLNHITLDFSQMASGTYAVQIFENNKLTNVSKIRKN